MINFVWSRQMFYDNAYKTEKMRKYPSVITISLAKLYV